MSDGPFDFPVSDEDVETERGWVKPTHTYGDVFDYSVKSSGQKVFESGAVRDADPAKPRPDYLDPRFLLRVGEHLRKGAEHYGPFNFDKGIPSQDYMASLLRHVLKYYAGDRTEDHLSAAVFNIQGIAMNEGTELDDLHEWKRGA